ncbi:uncharacterized protein JCM15063_001219 [Sporobolomyces koalae]|uniref:uncharacterized protein n=1 Tax=Sporobolomyces koalae TaxID=500713 RepID=UPI00317C3829
MAGVERPPPPAHDGTHCSLASCSRLDFLPLECPHCHCLFCQHHASPSTHKCHSESAGSGIAKEQASTSRAGPELRELLPDAKRHKLTTGSHATHSTNETPSTKQALALAALKKSIDAKKQQQTSTAPAGNGNATNPKIALMLLKQRAKPADPRKKEGDVPILERLYLRVRFVEGQDRLEKGVKEVWVSKSVTAGKVLDLAADLFQLTNVNNLANADPSKRLTLASSSSISPEQIDLAARIDSVVSNGSVLFLCRGAT